MFLTILKYALKYTLECHVNIVLHEVKLVRDLSKYGILIVPNYFYDFCPTDKHRYTMKEGPKP